MQQHISRREMIEKEQAQVLAPYACSVTRSKGRAHPEEADEYRTAFQRDRDRIIHTRAFRRLQGKTQVFFASEGDHFRNRLTHSLEVQQISRDIARALGLNEDLTEAIALAHDLGHTPFAHAGQDALDTVMKPYGKSFEHNVQSRRIVEVLESPYPDFAGLNLSLEVRDGLSKHTQVRNAKGEIQKIHLLESEVVDIADSIAYYHHDLDDGYRSELLDMAKSARNVYLIKESYDIIAKKYDQLDMDHLIRRLLKRIIDRMVRDIIAESTARIQKYKIKTFNDVLESNQQIVSFSEDMLSKVKQLRRYLYDVLYFSDYVKKQGDEGRKIITYLFEYYMQHIDQIPVDNQKRMALGDAPEEVVKDYIAGMTDRFAVEQYKHCYPKQKIKAIQMSLVTD